MKLTQENYDHLCVLTLRGEVTEDQSEELRHVAMERTSQQTRDFVVDLSAVETVNSRGLETLLWLQDHAAERLGQVRLAGAGENLVKILQITRLTPRFEIMPDVDAAIASLR